MYTCTVQATAYTSFFSWDRTTTVCDFQNALQPYHLQSLLDADVDIVEGTEPHPGNFHQNSCLLLDHKLKNKRKYSEIIINEV